MDITLSDGNLFSGTGNGIGQEIFAHCFGRYSEQFVIAYNQAEDRFRLWVYSGSSWTRYEASTFGTSASVSKIQLFYYQQLNYFKPFIVSSSDVGVGCTAHGVGSTNPFQPAGFYGVRYCHNYDACKVDGPSSAVEDGLIACVAVMQDEGSDDINIEISCAYFSVYTVLKTDITVIGAAPAAQLSEVKIIEIPSSSVVIVAYGGYAHLYSVTRSAAPVLVDSILTGVDNDTSVFDAVVDRNTGRLLIWNTSTACSCTVTSTTFGTPDTYSITDSDFDYLRSSVWSLYVDGEYGIAGATTESPAGPVFMKVSLGGVPYFTRPETTPVSEDSPYLFAYDPSEHGVNGIHAVLCPVSSNYVELKYVEFSGVFPLPESENVCVGNAVLAALGSSGYCDYLGVMGIGRAVLQGLASSGYCDLPIVCIGNARLGKLKVRAALDNQINAVLKGLQSGGFAWVDIVCVGNATLKRLKVSAEADVDILCTGNAVLRKLKSSGNCLSWASCVGNARLSALSSSGLCTPDGPEGIGNALLNALVCRGFCSVDTDDDVVDFVRDLPGGSFVANPDEEVVDYE